MRVRKEKRMRLHERKEKKVREGQRRNVGGWARKIILRKREGKGERGREREF